MSVANHEKEIPLAISNNEDKPSVKEVLKNTPFLLLFAAQLMQTIGSAVSWLAVQFLLFILTESPSIMGILSVIYWLPYVLITPLAGVFVDRLDQRKLMLLSNVISFLASMGYLLIYLFIDKLSLYNIITFITESNDTIIMNVLNPVHIIWPMFLFTFINSSAGSIFLPARNAYVRFIVHKKNLLIANSIGSTVFQGAQIIGYVLAGILAGISYLASFVFNASTFAFSSTMIILILIISLKPIKAPQPKGATFKAQVKSIFDDLKIGYKTIQKTPKVSYMLVVFAMTIFSFSTFSVLLIVILQGEMDLDETWYGILQSIIGVSGIITSLVFIGIGRIKRKILLLNISLAGAALFLFGFAVIRITWLMGILLFIFGIALATINVTGPTLIQEQIPYEKQGRVFGTQQLVQGIARLIGMGIVSIIAEYILPMYIILISAGILTIVMVFGTIYSTKKGIAGLDYVDKNIVGEPVKDIVSRSK